MNDVEETKPLKPQYTKIGRDITLEDYLNGTTEEHNGNGYSEWKREINQQVKLDGRINKERLGRLMGVSGKTAEGWLIADRVVQG